MRYRKNILLISHRLSNLKSADCIYVLEHGTLAEAGTHAALLQQEGIYAALYAQQQALEQYGMEPNTANPTQEVQEHV